MKCTYESDGGPGIRTILDLLNGSDDPEGDRDRVLKALIVFWLLGATDGHAKNFSIFLAPGGRFSATPLYDVVSAQPSVDAREIPRNRMKLAMAVGNSRHYVIDTIAPRHFVETAAKAGIGAAAVQRLFEEVVTAAPAAIDQVLKNLPEGFPDEIADRIVAGFRSRLRNIGS